jgi:hypothetical protein
MNRTHTGAVTLSFLGSDLGDRVPERPIEFRIVDFLAAGLLGALMPIGRRVPRRSVKPKRKTAAQIARAARQKAQRKARAITRRHANGHS